jgi:AI-2 transport protein TqsA
MNKIKLPFYAYIAFSLISLLLVLVFLYLGSNLLIPLFFGLLIAVLLYPLCRLIEKIGLGSGAAALIAILLFAVVLGSFCYFFSQQVVSFSEDLPELQKRAEQTFHQLQHWVYNKYHISRSEQESYITKSANNMLSGIANSLGNTFLAISNMLIWIIFIFFYAFFMLFYRRHLRRFLLSFFSDEHQHTVNEVISETKTLIYSYVLGLLIEMGILLVAQCTIFSIMGIKYAMLLGTLAAVLNIIPYLGIYTATAISMIVTFANGGATPAIEVGAILIGIHFIDANIMMPRIVGKRVNMNPFITILAVITGSMIWGVPGMFLFIPMIAIFKVICERVEGLKPWAILIGEGDKGGKKS